VFWEDTYPFVLTYTDGGRRGLTIADTQLGRCSTFIMSGQFLLILQEILLRERSKLCRLQREERNTLWDNVGCKQRLDVEAL